MKNYIPTIEELQGIKQSELSVMFRKAAQVAADESREPQERAAAGRTMEIIRYSLTAPKGALAASPQLGGGKRVI